MNLDPTVGTESKKKRPAIVVSNDSCNRYGTRVVVVPVASNIDSLYPGEAPVRIGKRPGRALGDQLRSVDRARIGKRISRLTAEELSAVDEALRTTLAL